MKTVNIIALLATLLFVVGCKNEKQNTNSDEKLPKSITLGSYFQAVDYAPFLIAKEKGWFEAALKEKSIKINYETFEDLAIINDAFLKNDLDVVFEAAPPAIVSESAKVGIDIVNISCSLTQEILVRKETDINSIADLKGKKIAVLSGTSSHYGVLKLLNDNNISESDLSIIDMAPVDAKIAFESDQIDAWAVWPPFVEQQEISGKGRVLPKGDVYIHSIMAVDEDFMKSYPIVFKKIDSVFNESKIWIINHEVEAIDIMAEVLNIDRAVIDRAWAKHDWSVILNKKILDDIQNKADFLVERKKINKKVDVAADLIELK
ncbi:MAG: aliphatic sulfonate ABC transporter substrate-binding protein [Bacteroidetes bacterium]|nr:aliphatic sulfonate ABC transporter substrate-binding protein [Bacteroidota bacterium]